MPGQLFYQGEEEEFYPDEIKDVILSILDEVLANTEEKRDVQIY